METVTVEKKSKPPYLLGLICLIPLVGAFVGVGLFLYGIIKYKDKWLTIIGVAGILWTIVFYGAFFYFSTHASVFKKGFTEVSQMQLNSLVRSVEFYKLEHGQYPDSLQQLLAEDPTVPLNDAIQGLRMKHGDYFNYEKLGEKYLLFSSGQDGIPNTKDDLFPNVIISDSSKIGFIKYKK